MANQEGTGRYEIVVVSLPILKSPKPSLKRKRAFVIIDESPPLAADPPAGPSSTSGLSQRTAPDEDEPMSFRLNCLKELGARESLDRSLVMSIPEDFFWNDQHPQLCGCHWCNLIFGTDR